MAPIARRVQHDLRECDEEERRDAKAEQYTPNVTKSSTTRR